MKPEPLVSIIVPSFNQGRYIKETLDSILGQDYRPIEILVIDGGSNDETLAVLKSFADVLEMRWWSEPDNGVADAVNKGLAKASGEILAIQSSDDIYLPRALSAAVEFMAAHSDVALVYGDVELINEHSEVIGRDILSPFAFNDYVGRFSYIPQPSAFFRRDVAREVGGWRQEVSYAADADYWMRIAVKHKVVKLDRLMARYRYHSEQRDIQSARIAQDWEKTIRSLLDHNDLNKEAKRFARMGIHLAKYRYTPETSWLRRSWYLYRAFFSNPCAVVDKRFPKREFVIGREPIWKLLSSIKRSLGFKPRDPGDSCRIL
jgi:glycosyltransferase involved in cell wall biosynthesis